MSKLLQRLWGVVAGSSGFDGELMLFELGRDRPQRFVIRNHFKGHAGGLKYWPLRQHRLEHVHLMRCLRRFPHADICQETCGPIDANVVMEQAA